MKRTLLIVLSAALLLGVTFISNASNALAHDDMRGMEMSDDSGGGTDLGPIAGMGKHMDMGPHMTMTPGRAATPADTARAAQILQTMREQLSKYQDYKVAEADGYVARVDALTVAHASTALGAGRERKGEPIDLSVGILLGARVGERVARGQPLATLHANDEARLAEAERVLRMAIGVSAAAVEARPLILERLGAPAAQPRA